MIPPLPSPERLRESEGHPRGFAFSMRGLAGVGRGRSASSAEDFRRGGSGLAQDGILRALGAHALLNPVPFLDVASGDQDTATTVAREAVELDPLHGYAHYALGSALSHAGRRVEAEETLSRPKPSPASLHSIVGADPPQPAQRAAFRSAGRRQPGEKTFPSADTDVNSRQSEAGSIS
jgi:hypothetical protein